MPFLVTKGAAKLVVQQLSLFVHDNIMQKGHALSKQRGVYTKFILSTLQRIVDAESWFSQKKTNLCVHPFFDARSSPE